MNKKMESGFSENIKEEKKKQREIFEPQAHFSTTLWAMVNLLNHWDNCFDSTPENSPPILSHDGSYCYFTLYFNFACLYMSSHKVK